MKPILFNTEMVRAILDGRKTVTRRVIKPQPAEPCTYIKAQDFHYFYFGYDKDEEIKPAYKTGDVLYVKETWGRQIRHGGSFFAYKADDENLMNYDVDKNGSYPTSKVKWKRYIHMPKEAARIFLKVTDVRVERLHKISFEEIEKEGIRPIEIKNTIVSKELATKEGLRIAMMKTWQSTVKKQYLDTYGWDANPWVWVIEFERVSKEDAE